MAPVPTTRRPPRKGSTERVIVQKETSKRGLKSLCRGKQTPVHPNESGGELVLPPSRGILGSCKSSPLATHEGVRRATLLPRLLSGDTGMMDPSDLDQITLERSSGAASPKGDHVSRCRVFVHPALRQRWEGEHTAFVMLCSSNSRLYA